MPTQPIGWAVVRWFPDTPKPKRLYTGDSFIAERIYNRTKAEIADGPGRVELLDTRNKVRQAHGYHQDRIPQARNLKTRKAQLLDVIDHSLSCSDSSASTSGTTGTLQMANEVPAATPDNLPTPDNVPLTVATPSEDPEMLP